jgi:hypothetical protein
MKWYHYLAVFAAGFFLTNTVPHLVQGATSNSFPTPFANPPGKGLSSPLINVLWACTNLFIGYILLRVSKLTTQNKITMFILFLGIVTASVMLSFSFAKN